jgi:hypothetical protein
VERADTGVQCVIDPWVGFAAGRRDQDRGIVPFAMISASLKEVLFYRDGIRVTQTFIEKSSSKGLQRYDVKRYVFVRTTEHSPREFRLLTGVFIVLTGLCLAIGHVWPSLAYEILAGAMQPFLLWCFVSAEFIPASWSVRVTMEVYFDGPSTRTESFRHAFQDRVSRDAFVSAIEVAMRRFERMRRESDGASFDVPTRVLSLEPNAVLPSHGSTETFKVLESRPMVTNILRPMDKAVIDVLVDEYPDAESGRTFWKIAGGRGKDFVGNSKAAVMWTNMWLQAVNGDRLTPIEVVVALHKDKPHNVALITWLRDASAGDRELAESVVRDLVALGDMSSKSIGDVIRRLMPVESAADPRATEVRVIAALAPTLAQANLPVEKVRTLRTGLEAFIAAAKGAMPPILEAVAGGVTKALLAAHGIG